MTAFEGGCWPYAFLGPHLSRYLLQCVNESNEQTLSLADLTLRLFLFLIPMTPSVVF